MYNTLTESDFIRQYGDCRPNEFSDEGLKLLWAELIRLEEEAGEGSEFDPGKIASEYNECSCTAFMEEFNLELDEDEEYEDDFEKEEACKELIKEFLENKSAFCAFTDEDTVVYFYNFE